MLLKFREVEVFWAVYKSQSVKAAGRMLNVSQPAVSMMLKSAEERFGVKLFERSGGRIRPTPEAKALFESTNNIFVELEEFGRQLERIREGRFGVLRIVGPPTLTGALIHPALASFRKLHPDVRIILQTVPTEQALSLVATGHADFGIAYGPGGHVGTNAEDIGSSQVACVLNRDHRLAMKMRIRPRDLVNETVMTYRFATPFGRVVEKMLRGPGAEIKVALETTALTAACLANAGYGVALIDPFAMNSGLFPNLTVRPFQPTATARVQVVTSRTEPLSLIGKDFLAEVRACVPRQFSFEIPIRGRQS